MRPLNLISNFLFVSVVLAGVIHQPHARRVVESHVERCVNGGYWESPNFSGAFWQQDPGTFNRVAGTFTAPTMSGQNHTGVYLWLGIDSVTCTSAYLITGITAVVSGDENTYSAWYKWSPHGVSHFDLAIAAGDVIHATVTVYNATSGLVTIDNLTTGQSQRQYLTSASPLCQQNAVWAVQVYQPNATTPPIGNFGTMTFWGTEASGTNGSYGVEGANTVVLHNQDNQTVTSVALYNTSLSITHL